MLHKNRIVAFGGRRSPRQAGVYALEYALVFPIFFLILYAIIGYGLAFTMRLSLQYAAEEGARAALQYRSTGAQRLQNAEAATRTALVWIPSSRVTVSGQICRRGAAAICWSGVGATPDCTRISPTESCSVEIRVVYDYSAFPIAPSLPGMGFIMPSELVGRASTLLERGLL